MSDLSPLSGVKRKLDFGVVRAAFDPKQTSAIEILSRFMALSGSRGDLIARMAATTGRPVKVAVGVTPSLRSYLIFCAPDASVCRKLSFLGGLPDRESLHQDSPGCAHSHTTARP